MNQESGKYAIDGSKYIQNMGGPRSRSRVEIISENFLEKQEGLSESYGPFSVRVPPFVQDIKDFLYGLASLSGYVYWDDIFKALSLPKEKMLVTEIEQKLKSPPMTDMMYVKAAIILSKCNKHMYYPDNLCVFTHTRLSRKIRLQSINVEKFYDMGL